MNNEWERAASDVHLAIGKWKVERARCVEGQSPEAWRRVQLAEEELTNRLLSYFAVAEIVRVHP